MVGNYVPDVPMSPQDDIGRLESYATGAVYIGSGM
jgi:hypothetical protein